MTHVENACGRSSDGKLGSVIAPTVQIDQPSSYRLQTKPCACQVTPSPQTRSAQSTFRYYVDSRGYQHFNFEQRLWPHPSVNMAVTPLLTIALETLAINLFAHVTGERFDQTSVGFSKRLIGLARRFCVECLLTAGPAGWVIPRSTIESWLLSQRGLQRAMKITILGPVRYQGAATRKRKPGASSTTRKSATRRPQAAPRDAMGSK